MAATDPTYRLLGLCARAQCDAAYYSCIAKAAADLEEWGQIPAQAEAHGLAPLLYVHLRTSEVQLPTSIQRELQGLYARHRRANAIRARVLRDVLTAYQAAGIQALVLKGAALAHIVYPEPGLRPMSDIDLLVKRSDAPRAQDLLAELGFDVPHPASLLRHRHLSAAVKEAEGLTVQVEVHHKLLSNYVESAIGYLQTQLRIGWVSDARAPTRGELAASCRPFDLVGLTAYALAHEDMLGHLCQHLVSHVNVWDFGRLIWVADIVSYAERFASEIDWQKIRQRHPAVLSALSLLHFVTPLSEQLVDGARVPIGRAPRGIGVEYQGWPRIRRGGGKGVEYRRFLRNTLFPSEWWLRLRYQLGSTRPLFWYRWMRHPLHILGQLVRAFLERLGWPTAVELAGWQTPR